MKTVVILKGKLYHVDNVLPLLFELSTRHVLEDVIFVVPTRRDAGLLRENRTLYAAIQRLGRLDWLEGLEVTSRDRGYRGLYRFRPLRLIRNLWVLRHYFLGAVLSLEIDDGRLLRLLATLNRRLYGGQRVFLLLDNMPLDLNERMRSDIAKAYGRTFRTRIRFCDLIVSSYTREQFAHMTELSAPLGVRWINVGYTRGMAAWLHYLDEAALAEAGAGGDEPYIFFPLTTLYRREPNGREYKYYEACEAVLTVLKRFDSRIRTVFRFHPTTDRAHMNDILRRTGLATYTISTAHPTQLIRSAKLMITYAGSTLMADAWFAGIPIVEFAKPGASLYDDLGGSPYESVIDYYIVGDEERLARVIDDLLSGRAEIHRDPEDRAQRFPVVDGEFLHRELAGLAA